jgi:NADH-quinone oxidoreductase subunit C
MDAVAKHPWYPAVKEAFGSAILSERESAPGELEIMVHPDKAYALLETLKKLPDGPFEHLADLTGYDETQGPVRFHVLYELISMLRKERLSVIAPVSNEAPAIRSICELWAGANWLERECFDMLGIRFEGHPDHRRLLMPESFQGHPLRKDFVVDYRQTFKSDAGEGDIFDPFGNTIVQGAED